MPPLTEEGVEAAADVLDKVGRHHGWWRVSYPSWREGDEISKSEFLGIVATMVKAYLEKANPAGSGHP